MTTARERIVAHVDAEIAKSGLQDVVTTPEDQKAADRYRRMMIANIEATAKLGPMPKP